MIIRNLQKISSQLGTISNMLSRIEQRLQLPVKAEPEPEEKKNWIQKATDLVLSGEETEELDSHDYQK